MQGSANLNLMIKAARKAGRYDGYWERELQPWDMAAGIILVREAGGMAQAVREGDDILASGSVICGNDGLFEPFCKTIRTT